MPSVEPMVQALYSRPQISDFLEKTEPHALLGLQQIYLTTNALDPNVGRKIRMIGERLPGTWDSQMEPLRDSNDPENFYKAVVDECKRVQDHYLLHKARFLDVGTLEGQKRLARETGALGSSIVLHFFNSKRIALNLAKGWLGLAKALNDGDFGVDEVLSLSFARYGANDETSRVKIQSTCQPTAEMVREIKKILKCKHLNCSIKIKNDVATYVASLTNENGWPRIFFDAPFRETHDVEKLAKQLEGLET